MSKFELAGVISDTSPGSASTAVSAGTVTNLHVYDEVQIQADLEGATGGTLDVYLQRKVANDLWEDWVHFAQLAAGASAVSYAVKQASASTILTVGTGSDASPGVALAANTAAGGHPGAEVRAVYVAGASTTLGSAQTIRVLGRRS